MKHSLGLICLTVAVLFAGCVSDTSTQLTTDTTNQVNDITISGIDKYQEVNSATPVKLVISGINNTVRVLTNTSVNSITISGIDITLYLPKTVNPQITDSGIKTRILYY